MRNSRKERRDGWIGAAAALALMIFGVTGIIRWIAGDARGMREAMMRFAPPESTGLPAEEYAGVAEMLTGYLTGREAVFQYTWTGPNGETLVGFHDYEAAHMKDCRALIHMDTAVCSISLCVAAGLITVIVLRIRKYGWDGRIPFLRGGWNGFLILIGMMASLALWAFADFDGFFLCFHRIAFCNDLWLLNPRTDLLIRLMPEKLFVNLGMRGLTVTAGWMALTGILLRLGIRKMDYGGKHGIQGNRCGKGTGSAGEGKDQNSRTGNQLR